jgi:hypothetical protein
MLISEATGTQSARELPDYPDLMKISRTFQTTAFATSPFMGETVPLYPRDWYASLHLIPYELHTQPSCL